MLNLNIEITGHRNTDVETALEETLRLVRAGCTSGMNSNDTGRFNFSVTGEAVAYYRGYYKSGQFTSSRYDDVDAVPACCLAVPFSASDQQLIALPKRRRKNRA